MNEGQKYEKLDEEALDNRIPEPSLESERKCEPSESGEPGPFTPMYESFASTKFKTKRSFLYKLCTPLKKGTPNP
jgi:hypothetical protein